MNKISVVIPCYNEEESIPLVYREVSQVLATIPDVDYELLFINDGSKDNSEEVLKSLSDQDSHFIYYSFSRNFGKEAAMYAGLEKSTGDYVVIMDADLQHPPQLLAQMYQVLTTEKYDCCAGKRVDREGEGRLRNFLSRSFYKVIQKLTKMDMSDGAGDFRMMSRQMVNAILELKEYNRYLKGIFSFVGFDTKWIEFHNVERVAGKTKWSFRSLFAYALEGIFSFSSKPILYAGTIGGTLILLSFGILLYVGVSFLFFHHYFTMAWYLIILLLFLSGVQLFFVSILGQYLTKNYFESKQRPIYIIKSTNKQDSIV